MLGSYAFSPDLPLQPRGQLAWPLCSLFADLGHVLGVLKDVPAFWVGVAFEFPANDGFVFSDRLRDHLLATTLLIHGANCVPLFPG